MKYKAANTGTFIELCDLAMKEHRNRQVNVRRLEKEIDPNGVHVCWFNMMHNDVEMRTSWYVKLKDKEEPIILFLDMSFERYNSLSEIGGVTSE